MDKAKRKMIVSRSQSMYHRSTSVAATAETEVMFFDS